MIKAKVKCACGAVQWCDALTGTQGDGVMNGRAEILSTNMRLMR